jgi:hypothetical protein
MRRRRTMPEISQATFDALRAWVKGEKHEAALQALRVWETAYRDRCLVPAPRKPFHEALQDELGEGWEIYPSRHKGDVLVYCHSRREWPQPWVRIPVQDDPKKVANALRLLAGASEEENK